MMINSLKTLVILTLLSIIITSFVSYDKQQDDFIQSKKRGEELYISNCISCHMYNGEGVPSVFPPLAGSDFLNENQDKAIQAIIYGLKGEIAVNGLSYNAEMTPIELNDQEIVDVLNYINNSWGNSNDPVDITSVKKERIR